MTPQDAEIIRTLFDRLKAMGDGPRDAEAEGFVEARLRADPTAGLALVRALVMTERAREAASAEIDSLRAEVQALQAQGGRAAAPAPSGGLFDGPWGRPQTQQPPPMPQTSGGAWGGRVPDAGPWGGGQPQPQGNGFWGSALRTGAGVAGGLFAFEALKGLFGGGSHGGGDAAGLFGGGTAASGGGLFDAPQTVVNETVNIFQRDDPSRTSTSPDPAPGLFDASSDGYDDGGGFGGDDDWA